MDKKRAVTMRPWHTYDWEEVMAGNQVAQRYFVRSGLIRKDRLCSFVPDGFHPDTVVVRNFEGLLQALVKFQTSAEMTSNKGVVKYVLKKAQSSNAFGIRFITDMEAAALLHTRSRRQIANWSLAITMAAALISSRMTRRWHGLIGLAPLLAAVWRFGSSCSWPSDWGKHQLADPEISDLYVLQRNVDPWLHLGRKFHLRVLLLCVGDLKAYVCEDVRVLLATGKYADGCSDSGRLDVHITNMAANSEVSGYCEKEQNVALKELGEQLATKIFGELSQVLAETLSRLRQAGRRHFFTLPNCWELFGADFLLEAVTARPVLLEINPSPSLAMYSSDLASLIGDDPLNVPLPRSWCELLLA